MTAAARRAGAFSAVGRLRRSPRDFIADFDVNVASDDSFLQQFDYSDADLLTSVARVQRTRDRGLLLARHHRASRA